MRNGDAYKIKSMAKAKVSDSEIVEYFRNRYDADEVKRFIPSPPLKKSGKKKSSK